MNKNGIKIQLFGISLILVSISFWNLAEGASAKHQLINLIILALGLLISIMGFIKKD